jgi:DNA-binding CsgD family transcriptional regulator
MSVPTPTPTNRPTREPAREPNGRDAEREEGRGLLWLQLECVLDRLSEGCIVIDADARVLHANRRARELLRRANAPAGSPGRLEFADARTQRAFRLALVATPDVDPAEHSARNFLVRDAAGATRARASVETLRRRRDAEGLPERYLVSLHEVPQHSRVSTRTLRALYGLTPSEARVASEVVAAGSIPELARRLALSKNTVKTHLRHTFRKCEVTTLAQLTALIATGPREQ